jgi:predicted MFS family arabinose efflux permease
MLAAARDPARTVVEWQAIEAALLRGYWLVTSLYLVVVADLSPFQLVFLGTAMELSVMLTEVPTGVFADTISRKWSIVISHVLTGSAMMITGLVRSFGPLVAAQVLWGVGYTFQSGAVVAWVTDELADPSRIELVLVRQARAGLVGALLGMPVFGALAWATSLGSAIVVSGVAGIVLAAWVAWRFSEERFTPTREHRLAEARSIFVRGVALARGDRQIIRLLAVTLLVNSGAEAFDRLYPKRLVGLGFPSEPDPIVWFTVLGIATAIVGWVVLRGVERHVAGERAARRLYAAACAAGTLGLLTLAHAPNDTIGIAGVLFVSGIAWTVVRSVSVIWVNRRATSDVRATLQSFLTQTESTGEIIGGLTLGVVAQSGSITTALTCSAVLLLAAGTLVM